MKKETKGDKSEIKTVDLREQAEKIARKTDSLENIEMMSPEERRILLHELRVHQVELEMQNDELVRTQMELGAQRERYFDLYDLAPVGYITVNKQGLIIEANFTAATILGVAKNTLSKALFTRFIIKEDQDIYYRHRKELFETGKQQTCELRMVKKDDTHFWSHFETIAAKDAEGEPVSRIVLSDITERKMTEEALRKSRDQLKVAHRLARIGIWNWVAKTDTVNWSEELYNIAGIDPSKPSPSYAEQSNIYVPESWALLKKAVERAQQTGESYQLELQLIRPDGKTCWVYTFGGAMYDDNGRKIGLHGTLQDITERKLTQAALQDSEAQKNAILNGITTNIALVDKELKILWVNNAALNSAKKLGEEMIGSTCYSFWGDKVAPCANCPTIRAFQTGKSEHVIVETPDGRIWDERGEPILDASGNVTAVVEIAQDITERKRADEILRKSEERLQLALQGAGEGIIDWDLVTDGIIASPELAKMLGYDVEEFPQTGKSLLALVHVDDRETVNAAFRDLVKGRTSSLDIEERFPTKAGGWKWVLARGKITSRNASGKAMQYIGTHMDITDRKHAEEEKKILEERLSRAEKFEALGLLAGGVAHDLNNVLGIVVGYTELLLDAVDEKSPLIKDLTTIFDGGQKAAAIVNDLLTVARRGVLDRKILNLNKLIGDLKKSPSWSKLLTYHPHVQISIDLDPDLLNISASFFHLEKTLYNLISNAGEAMTKGGTITIKTSNRYVDKPISSYDKIREGDYVVLSVSDEGDGISEKDLKRIFEPFYTKKIMGRSGTGLGLSVVWGTVKDHQGYIDVQSEEGKGTTFTLYFLVTREDITEEGLAVSMSEYLGNGQSVLVIDDVKEQRDLAARLLKALNYNVFCATSGEEAIRYLKEHKVDLLVLDMIMDPGMDGLDTYKSTLEINPKQKAIIVSGFSESDRVKEAKALGAGAYIKKPYIKEKLGLAVKKELENKR